MGLSVFKILLIVIVVLIVFGAGKLPKVMEDLGEGLKNFKKAMNDDPKPEENKLVENKTAVAPEEAEKTEAAKDA